MKAQDIVDLLSVRHSEDIFVSQCKNGPTTSVGKGQLCIIDCWAMKRSWSNPLMTAYEIKVSRGDFVNDDKWQRYLAYCNCFYFACPYGLIEPEELPGNVGLVWVAKTGNRLFTKRKAPHRAIDVPVELLQYLLICRARIGEHDILDKKRSNLERWKIWLEDKKERKDIGWEVSKEMRQRYDAMKERAKKAERIEKNLNTARSVLKEVFKIDPGEDYNLWLSFEEKFRERLRQNGSSEELIKKLDQASETISAARQIAKGKK